MMKTAKKQKQDRRLKWNGSNAVNFLGLHMTRSCQGSKPLLLESSKASVTLWKYSKKGYGFVN